ncbi:L-rhamnose isomerase [Rubrobacter xylanophilus]|uniref:L-rhamnose isomerase n=1 Tax=Rubrobacter xylanophilus TaxID=49319 RepID=A0A510HGT4_9ACTN|nr:L-rhamnose isomerase [Rubrobacter xylanophilus]BBL79161.1 L-rhamnose isomerase [Rubrobacter xylanophilus]
MEAALRQAYEAFGETQAERGVDLGAVEERLRAQRVETPSWGYGNSGTRFAVFPQPGVPRNPFEKLQDAAQVHAHTGICPSVALHIPWDRVEDYRELADYAASLGLRLGAINPNLFQDEEYRLGSVCNPDPAVRRRATDHLLECVEIAGEVKSRVLSLWLADGTNYPGQDSFVERRGRMLECLSEVYGRMPEDMRLLLEYKLFEPAFYHTDLCDWGTALTMCQKLGERALVLVDLGHHAQGVNVEHIVSLLLDEGRLGGFHFNNRKYADDDLIVGSVNPFELFLIYVELLEAEENPGVRIEYMIDQAHNIEPKIEAMILSVMNLQEAYAKALLVDREALREARRSGDVLSAHRVLLDAYSADVRPLCAKLREDLGGSADPVAAFRASGYLERVAEERREGRPAGWG